MLTVPFSVLHISIYLIKLVGVEDGVVVVVGLMQTWRYVHGGGGVQSRLSFFLSIVLHASTKLRTPAPRGMAGQHLRTFERDPVNKELLTGTRVLVNNLFLSIYQITYISKKMSEKSGKNGHINWYQAYHCRFSFLMFYVGLENWATIYLYNVWR